MQAVLVQASTERVEQAAKEKARTALAEARGTAITRLHLSLALSPPSSQPTLCLSLSHLTMTIIIDHEVSCHSCAACDYIAPEGQMQ